MPTSHHFQTVSLVRRKQGWCVHNASRVSCSKQCDLYLASRISWSAGFLLSFRCRLLCFAVAKQRGYLDSCVSCSPIGRGGSASASGTQFSSAHGAAQGDSAVTMRRATFRRELTTTFPTAVAYSPRKRSGVSCLSRAHFQDYCTKRWIHRPAFPLFSSLAYHSCSVCDLLLRGTLF